MKVYTHEDVLAMMNTFHTSIINRDFCMAKLTPIEINEISDEEIQNKAPLHDQGVYSLEQPFVIDSLPSKEEVIDKGYTKAKNANYNYRRSLKDLNHDLYFSGWMDCFDWLTTSNLPNINPNDVIPSSPQFVKETII